MTTPHKRIAVIGNGSSGVQIVPQIAMPPGTMVINLARGPSWIYYRVSPSQHLGKSGKSGNNREYTEEDSADGKVEAWTDLQKPKNVFTGAEKATCVMAPRHLSTIVKFEFYKMDKLTQSASKGVFLLGCRDSSKCIPLSFRGSHASGSIATRCVKRDLVQA